MLPAWVRGDGHGHGHGFGTVEAAAYGLDTVCLLLMTSLYKLVYTMQELCARPANSMNYYRKECRWREITTVWLTVSKPYAAGFDD